LPLLLEQKINKENKVKNLLVISVLLASCYIEPLPPPYPHPQPPIYVPHSYCGDGICDEWNGENGYWCWDCGFDPYERGYCGDGICQEGSESCPEDCQLYYNSENNPFDPGYIDPRPE